MNGRLFSDSLPSGWKEWMPEIPRWRPRAENLDWWDMEEGVYWRVYTYRVGAMKSLTLVANSSTQKIAFLIYCSHLYMKELLSVMWQNVPTLILTLAFSDFTHHGNDTCCWCSTVMLSRLDYLLHHSHLSFFLRTHIINHSSAPFHCFVIRFSWFQNLSGTDFSPQPKKQLLMVFLSFAIGLIGKQRFFLSRVAASSSVGLSSMPAGFTEGSIYCWIALDGEGDSRGISPNHFHKGFVSWLRNYSSPWQLVKAISLWPERITRREHPFTIVADQALRKCSSDNEDSFRRTDTSVRLSWRGSHPGLDLGHCVSWPVFASARLVNRWAGAIDHAGKAKPWWMTIYCASSGQHISSRLIVNRQRRAYFFFQEDNYWQLDPAE